MSQLIPATSAANLLIWLYFITIISTYFLKTSLSPWGILKIVGLYSLSSYGIFWAVLGINQLGEFRHPDVFSGFLLLFLQLPVTLIYNNFFLAIRALFFPSYSLNLSIAIYLPILLALELWRPGITLSLGQRIAQNIINKIRPPIVFEGFGNSPLLITIILLGLGTLVTMLYQYWQSGLLGSLEVNLLLALLFRLILLPLVLVVMLIRSPIFYRLESQCLQSSV